MDAVTECERRRESPATDLTHGYAPSDEPPPVPPGANMARECFGCPHHRRLFAQLLLFARCSPILAPFVF